MLDWQTNYLDTLNVLDRTSHVLPLVTPSATVLVESPFFLQLNEHVFASQRLSQDDEEILDPHSIFPITKLPVELQLRVLWHCLVSSLPIFNAGLPKDNLHALVENETAGQHRIKSAITLTCKSYYHEGTKFLYCNHFAYTFSSQKEIAQIAKWRSFSRIQKLILRALCHTGMPFAKAAANMTMYALRHLRCLNTLQIDFCGADLQQRHPYDEDDDQDEDEYDSLSLLFESVDNILVERMHTKESTKGFSELILTGLPENDVGLSVLRALSSLVRANGKVAIGTSTDGTRYTLEPKDDSSAEELKPQPSLSDQWRMIEVTPQIHWLRMDDVGDLINRAASNTSSEWLFGDMGLATRKKCTEQSIHD
ncbi:MAG: hypothetical protein Q9197_004503 [Variospora fuerteventurae]